MKSTLGLIGRDALVEEVVREIQKGKHVLLTGPMGIGKSAILEAAMGRIERRQSERQRFEPLFDETCLPEPELLHSERRGQRRLTLVYLRDHQAKGQFVSLARRLLEAGLIKPSTLDLPKRLDEEPPGRIEWVSVRRSVNRLSVRDLTGAIIPAIYNHNKNGGRILIAVDDMTRLTPTQQAFWLAVFDHAQVVTCASEKGRGWAKLWWKMKEITIPPLPPEAATELVRTYIAKKGVLIESPELYVSHVVKQANGNPQAIHDMLEETAKERLVDKKKIREMKHQAGARYLAIGLSDTALYILAGMSAALFLSLRFLLVRGVGKAN